MIQINEGWPLDGGLPKKEKELSEEVLEYMRYIDSQKKIEQSLKNQISAHKSNISHWTKTPENPIVAEDAEHPLNYVQQQKAELRSLEEKLKETEAKIEIAKKWLEENS